MTLHDLLAVAPRQRIRAIRELDVPALALRRMLFTDRDANVRAVAARALSDHDDTEEWFLDAVDDRSPLVRDAVVRGLSRRGGDRARPVLRALAAGDRMWWVRRAAIYALATIAGASELDAFKAALADPFWRVRYAAVRVLAALGARDLDVRASLAGDDSRTAAFLRASWGPIAIEAPDRANSPSTLPAELLDPDPAVVTARLAAGSFDPLALVELLCDPHAPLRILAAQRIAASDSHAAYVAALDWLEEPRVPHVADTVEHLLDNLGDATVPVATAALAREDRPGAARWAIAWVASTHHEPLYEVARVRARTDASLRVAALRLASTDELVAWAREADVDAIADELHARREDGAETLLALDGSDHPRTRALQVDTLARLGRWTEVAAALTEPHHGPRALAIRWVARAGAWSSAIRAVDPGIADPGANSSTAGDVERELATVAGDAGRALASFDVERYLADPDPAIREAAITPVTAARLVCDADPWVARAASQMLASAFSRDATPEVLAAALVAHDSPDPQVRANACQVAVDAGALLARTIEALGDRDEGVRAAAHGALDRVPDDRVRALLVAPAPTAGHGRLSPLGRTMARAWLARRLDDAATADALAAMADEPEPRARAVLAAIAGIPSEPIIEVRTPREPRPPRQVAAVAHRTFGRAGFAVAPLAVSGAFELPGAALEAAAEAGADTFFWEPSYDNLTRFLRGRAQRGLHVVAGSYHAEAPAIEADVDRALRWLRRDTLDVFLLFWTRSPARVDAAAFDMLARIKATGKVRAIGFSTHHRDLARAAIETSPWDAVMIRHSAAHPGIETELLPTARERGTAVITFSALCYGRMVSGAGAPSAADCYRYALSQPGVVACISAPRRRRELDDNLAVLADPTLPAERLAALREHGVGVRAENHRFNTLMRQPTRDAAAAARELLERELPPHDEIAIRPLPRPAARPARTSLGTTRRRR